MTVADHSEHLASDAAPEAGHRAGSAAYRRVVAALFLAGLATFALLYSTQALLPQLARDFGVTEGASTLTVSLTTIALACTLLLVGPLSDVVGRTRLVHLSLGLAAAIGLLCAVAPTFTTLLVLRALLGVALAGLPAVATAYLREELHPGTQARAAGLYIGGTALGGMAGRLVTAGAADLAGWRWALATTGLLALACAVAVRLLLPPSRGFVPAPAGVRPAVRMTARALADPALLSLYAIGALSMGALVASLNTVGFRLEAPPFGLGLGAASLVFLVYPLGSISSALAGRAADAVGRHVVPPVAALVAVAGVVVTLAARLDAVVLGLALLVIGFFAVHGTASGWVPVRAQEAGVSAGQAASLYLVAYYAGASVFGSLAGLVWSAAGWGGVVAMAAALMTLSGALAVGLRRGGRP
ncbi:MFS transporter [Nocardioides nanhaiensis]|uniref:MFS transporter n=1 Tax=Nocardioides nanhaiensis TaxID=1476871 RepID=A0ABP8WM57_9ACTN